MSNYNQSQKPARNKFYKDARAGKICGIFEGLAQYSGISATVLRVLGIVTLLFSGPIVIVAYLLLSLVLENKPGTAFERHNF